MSRSWWMWVLGYDPFVGPKRKRIVRMMPAKQQTLMSSLCMECAVFSVSPSHAADWTMLLMCSIVHRYVAAPPSFCT